MEQDIKKCACGEVANGKYYYPYLGGLWKYQCAKCAAGFQVFEPLSEFKGASDERKEFSE